VLDIIGASGLGLVYRAEDLKLERQAALTFLPREWSTDPMAQRFEHEPVRDHCLRGDLRLSLVDCFGHNAQDVG
jgi:hypothetical protein